MGAADEMTIDTSKSVPVVNQQKNTILTPQKKATRAVFQPLLEMKAQKLKEKDHDIEKSSPAQKKSAFRSIRFREMPCPVCATPPFRTQAKLFDHLKECHSEYWEKNKPLTKAQKELRDMDEVTHDDVTGFYNCNICGKKMNSATNMVRHVNSVHRNVKEIICEICNKPFSKIQNYERHLRVHDGKKPYVCDICGKDFSRYDKLLDHKRRIHKIFPESSKTRNNLNNDIPPISQQIEQSNQAIYTSTT